MDSRGAEIGDREWIYGVLPDRMVYFYRICTIDCERISVMTEKITTTSCECCRHTERTERERKRLMTRLKTMEGQIRGIERLVENDAYCPDIVMQVSAVSNALNSFNKLLLAAHIRGCVAEDIREGKEDKVDELCAMLEKLMK